MNLDTNNIATLSDFDLASMVEELNTKLIDQEAKLAKCDELIEQFDWDYFRETYPVDFDNYLDNALDEVDDVEFLGVTISARDFMEMLPGYLNAQAQDELIEQLTDNHDYTELEPYQEAVNEKDDLEDEIVVLKEALDICVKEHLLRQDPHYLVRREIEGLKARLSELESKLSSN